MSGTFDGIGLQQQQQQQHVCDSAAVSYLVCSFMR